MWVRTETLLVNLDTGATIGVFGGSREGYWDVVHVTPKGYQSLGSFPYKLRAEAAMDKLEVWLCRGGLNTDIQSPGFKKVFSFRTLSDDDEF